MTIFGVDTNRLSILQMSNWGQKRLSNSYKVIHLVTSGAGLQTRASWSNHCLTSLPLHLPTPVQSLAWLMGLFLTSRSDHSMPAQKSLWLFSVFRINSKVLSGNIRAHHHVTPLNAFTSSPLPHACLAYLWPLRTICEEPHPAVTGVPIAHSRSRPSLGCTSNLGFFSSPFLAYQDHLFSRPRDPIYSYAPRSVPRTPLTSQDWPVLSSVLG